MFDLYFDVKKYEEAVQVLNKVVNEDPNFQISSFKIVKWASALAHLGRFQGKLRN